MFFLASGVLSTLALLSIPNGSHAQFLEIFGTGFCVDFQGQFYARGAAEKFDDPQACLDNCLRLDDSDLVGIAYKYSNKRCHCNYNVGSAVIATCDRSVFTNGCRSNKGYHGEGQVSGTNGPSSWNCYMYDPSPTFTPLPFVDLRIIPVEQPTPDNGGDGDSTRFLQTTAPVASRTVAVTPVSEPTPKGTKKGSGGKHKGKRNLQTSSPVSRSPVVIETLAPRPTPKATKKGSGSKHKGKRNLQTSSPVSRSPVVIETLAPRPTPKGTKKGSDSKHKGKRNLQTSSPVSRSPIAIETLAPKPTPKVTKKGSGGKHKGKRNLQTSSPVAIETPVPNPTPKGTKKGGGKTTRN